MARAFKRTRAGIQVKLDPGELELLQSLVDLMAGMVRDVTPADRHPENPSHAWARELGLGDLIGVTETPAAQGIRFTQEPEDPALARLLPDGHRDDPLAAAEFRNLTQRCIADHKVANLRTTSAVLTRWTAVEPGRKLRPHTCTEDEGWAVASALTDIRLVLATRLGIETDEDAEAIGTNPAPDSAWLEQVYQFLTWLQETLMHALQKGLNPDGDGSRTPPPGLTEGEDR